MKKRTGVLIGILLISMSLSGCASQQDLRYERTKKGYRLTGTRKFLFWESESLPAGEYSLKEGDKEFKANTKNEPFKLFGDLNLGKADLK